MTSSSKAWRKICRNYRPYHTMPAFNEGVRDYVAIKRDPYENDHTARGQLNSQAWARGANAMMRFRFWKRYPAERR